MNRDLLVKVFLWLAVTCLFAAAMTRYLFSAPHIAGILLVLGALCLGFMLLLQPPNQW